jgi:hypothetical protein
MARPIIRKLQCNEEVILIPPILASEGTKWGWDKTRTLDGIEGYVLVDNVARCGLWRFGRPTRAASRAQGTQRLGRQT